MSRTFTFLGAIEAPTVRDLDLTGFRELAASQPRFVGIDHAGRSDSVTAICMTLGLGAYTPDTAVTDAAIDAQGPRPLPPIPADATLPEIVWMERPHKPLSVRLFRAAALASLLVVIIARILA